MKKKLLFIIPSLDIGGAEKALVNLLSHFDFNKHDVDLLLFTKKGALINEIPSQVQIIFPGKKYAIFSQHIWYSCFLFLIKFQFSMIFHRIMFAHKNRKYPKGLAEQKSWKHFMASFSLPRQSYDVAIGYLEKTSIYCCVDVVDAKRKIGFIRTNYTALKLDKNFDQNYFEKLDILCANGQQSLQVLQAEFPNFLNKLKLVPNVSIPSRILLLAQEKVIDIKKNEGALTILSIGRLDQAKGYDLAVKACQILKQKVPKVNWYVIGEGPERGVLEQLIEQCKLREQFHLLGMRVNPYPYLKMADVFVQSSRYEGKSNTIEEAKILNKPIVVTNFEAVFEQIENGFSGYIVDQKPEAIAKAIYTLYSDEKLRLSFEENLAGKKYEARGIEDFYRILEI